jgi:hypothetical protein
MARKRVRRQRTVYVLTGDFAQGLEAFKEASHLPWAEIARLLGTSVLNLWRWRKQGVQPNMHHFLALQQLAEERRLAHLLPRAKALHGHPED